jgi:membrane protein implicated in regulation of membrane protease activity
MTAKAWLIIGMVLMMLELVVPGFVIIFFGIGAVLVGLLTWLIPGLSDIAQLFLLPILSIAGLAVFRRYFVKSVVKAGTETGTNFDDNDCIGKVVKVVEAIAPETPGKVELNGVNWTASCESAVSVGQNVKIVSRSGLTLVVVPA